MAPPLTLLNSALYHISREGTAKKRGGRGEERGFEEKKVQKNSRRDTNYGQRKGIAIRSIKLKKD